MFSHLPQLVMQLASQTLTQTLTSNGASPAHCYCPHALRHLGVDYVLLSLHIVHLSLRADALPATHLS